MAHKLQVLVAKLFHELYLDPQLLYIIEIINISNIYSHTHTHHFLSLPLSPHTDTNPIPSSLVALEEKILVAILIESNIIMYTNN